MNIASPNNTDTFFGGRLVTVLHEDGSTEDIKVRQLRLADYQPALPLIEDEIALTAFCCQTIPISVVDGATTSTPLPRILDKPWALTLQPDSYEQLQAVAREVNGKGFFSFAARTAEKERRAKEEIVRTMANMPPETLRAVKEMADSASLNSPPRPRLIAK